MTSNDSQSKFGGHPLLIVLGVLSTSFLTVLGIWGDDEIRVRSKVKRSPSPIEHREAFNQSLKEAIEDQFSSTLCSDPYKFFFNFKIGNTPLTPTLDANFWHKNLPSLEREAYRRCETSPRQDIIRTCFVFSPEALDGEGFLSAEFAFMEMYLAFRDPRTKTGLSCEQAVLSQQAQLSGYYSLYWPSVDQEKKDFDRMTGGFDISIQNRLEATNKLR